MEPVKNLVTQNFLLIFQLNFIWRFHDRSRTCMGVRCFNQSSCETVPARLGEEDLQIAHLNHSMVEKPMKSSQIQSSQDIEGRWVWLTFLAFLDFFLNFLLFFFLLFFNFSLLLKSILQFTTNRRGKLIWETGDGAYLDYLFQLGDGRYTLSHSPVGDGRGRLLTGDGIYISL